MIALRLLRLLRLNHHQSTRMRISRISSWFVQRATTTNGISSCLHTTIFHLLYSELNHSESTITPIMAEEASKSILVVSRYHPGSVVWKRDEKGGEEPILDSMSEQNDHLDEFNHPRYRRALILRELLQRSNSKTSTVAFEIPFQPATTLDMYQKVHSTRLIDFFTTAWKRWDDLGQDGQDSMCNGGGGGSSSPALIPGNVPLPREPYQRPSQNVMGQIGFFCTDTCTPIFETLLEELLWDAAVVKHAVDAVRRDSSSVAYALATHPGHHAAQDSFGGYCYVNHAAMAARLLQQDGGFVKVAILDVDYHCGNGTASIFYQDPSVLMISIHCHPDCEYPFHSGFYDETGAGEGEGATLHLPLMPGTTWETYSQDMRRAMEKIQEFGADSLVVSLGLDTYLGDPCAMRRAGFTLEGQDYARMGEMIASAKLPTVVIQEGGYKMDAVPQAVADVLFGICSPSS